MFIFITRFQVTGAAADFERALGRISEHSHLDPGFHTHRLYRSRKDPAVYVEVAEWSDPEAHRRFIASPAFQEPIQEVRKLATAEPAPFELLAEHVPTGPE